MAEFESETSGPILPYCVLSNEKMTTTGSAVTSLYP